MATHVRVSEILSRLQSFADIDPEVLAAKSLIGTNVHKAILQDCEGEFAILESDRARAYYQSYEVWRKTNTDPIKQIPRLYCDTLMLTGECDGLLNNEHIIDWKCSASANQKIWNMQAHFYWYLLKQNGHNPSHTMTWVNLRHKKLIKKDPKTNIGEFVYLPLDPIAYEFKFNENVLSDCIDEVHKYWHEHFSAKCIA